MAREDEGEGGQGKRSDPVDTEQATRAGEEPDRTPEPAEDSPSEDEVAADEISEQIQDAFE